MARNTVCRSDRSRDDCAFFLRSDRGVHGWAGLRWRVGKSDGRNWLWLHRVSLSSV